MDYTGKQIGKYEIKRLIGEGGMAAVYEGEHEKLGTKAAIKVLNPILSANKQIHERFTNEAKMMASLNHPNITKVIDYEETDTTMAIVMEYLEGQDLSAYIKSKGKLSEGEVKKLFEQTLSAFEYAHKKSIVHRDIKPSNIFILPDNTVKILDFGIAKLYGQSSEMTQTGTQMGTPIYMSPEQVKADKSIDYRSDIYSLGVTMYFALNGQAPYDSTQSSQFDIFNKIVYEPLPPITTGAMTELVNKACNKDRNLRFQSCQEWIEALNKGVKKSAPIADKTIIETPSEPSVDQTIIETPTSSENDKTVVEKSARNIQNNAGSQQTQSAPTNHIRMKETKIGIIGCIILACVIGAGILIRDIAGGTSSDATWNAYPDWDAIRYYDASSNAEDVDVDEILDSVAE